MNSPLKILILIVAILTIKAEQNSKPKNVLMIIYDDLRQLQSETYNTTYSQSHTPNFDTLAKKSLVFDNAYVQQAVCGPSRASIFSGRRPDETQMWNFVGSWRDTEGAKDWTSWPQFFKNAGYMTTGAGKVYHHGDPESADCPYSWDASICGKKNNQFPYSGQGNCPTSPSTTYCPVDTSKYNQEKLESDMPDLRATRIIKEQLQNAGNDTDRPFFIALGFVKPHLPHIFPQEYLDLIPEEKDIQLATNQWVPKNSTLLHWMDGKQGCVKPKHGPTAQCSEEKSEEWRRGYYAAYAFTDDLLGEVLDELNNQGLQDDTMIIITADHGWGLGEHNHWEKFTIWETDTRVPLLIHVPWISESQGKRTSSLMELVDLYPTTAELAGLKLYTNETIGGTSQAALLTDPSTEIKDAAFSQYPRCCSGSDGNGKIDCSNWESNPRCSSVDKTRFSYMGYGIRTARWRYIEWASWDQKNLAPIWASSVPNDLVELYDHNGDNSQGSETYNNFENQNVAYQNADVVKELSTKLRSFFDKNYLRKIEQ